MKYDRIENAPRRRLVGPNRTYDRNTREGIPQQWANWDYGAVQGVCEDMVFGVSHGFCEPDQFCYACALSVTDDATVPAGQSAVEIPAGHFAVYVHNGHVSGIAAVFDAVMCGPKDLGDGWQLAPGPQLEVYGDNFDPMTATGRVEVWFPVRRGG